MEFSFSSSASCVNDCGGENMSLVAEKNDVVSVDEYLADEYFLDFETEDEENETHQQQQEEGKENIGFGEEVENSSTFPSVLPFEAPPPLPLLSLPTHDVAELEWVSIIMDESLSDIPKTYENHQIPPKIKADDEAQPCPPPIFVPVKAKRSKRARTLSGSWSSSSSSSCSTTTTTTTTSSASSSSFPSPQLILTHPLFHEIPRPVSRPPPPPSKKRGRKPKVASNYQTESREVVSHGERRCSHCGARKTPQWRAGPYGAKTLCNACGVRYKSGRLLPEYRPACSPTFMSHVHSNSHRKVLEMRRKKEDREADKLLFVRSAPPVASF